MKKQVKDGKKEKSEKKTTDKPVKSKREKTDKLVKIDQNLIASKKCALTKTSLILDESITENEFVNVGRCLKLMKKTILWWIGDWGLFAELNEDFWFSSALEEVRESYSDGTIENAVWICKKIEPSRRREKLSFGHHQVVAGDSPKEQDLWLDLAEECKFSVMELRKLRWKVYRKRNGWSDVGIGDFYDIASKCKSEMNSLGDKLDRMIEFREKCDSDLCDGHIKYIDFFRSSELLLTKVAIISKGTNIFKTAQEKANEKNKENKDDEKNAGFFQGGHGYGLLVEMISADWEEIPEVGAKKWIKQKRREHIDKQLARHLSESEVEAN